MAELNPGMVYSLAITPTVKPSFLAVAAVTGPMQATSEFFISSAASPFLNIAAKLVTVDDEVKVTASI